MKKALRKAIDDVAQVAHELIVSTKGFNNSQLEDAIEASGIDVRYFYNEEFDGFLKWDKQRQIPIIAVNASQSATRQRFSMAHELGHLIIDWHWLPYGKNDKSKFENNNILNVTLYRGGKYSSEEQKEETIANEFAAAFLMPNSVLKELTDNISNSELSYSEALYNLKNKSNVSMISAGYRLKNYCDSNELNIMTNDETTN